MFRGHSLVRGGGGTMPGRGLLFIVPFCFRVPEDPFKCFEHDNPPVDTSATFYDNCKDNHGNIYKPIISEDPAQLTSCCECLE